MGQTKQFQSGSNAISGFQSCFPPAPTPTTFALLSPTQVLRDEGRFHQRTRFKIHHGDELAEDGVVGLAGISIQCSPRMARVLTDFLCPVQICAIRGYYFTLTL